MMRGRGKQRRRSGSRNNQKESEAITEFFLLDLKCSLHAAGGIGSDPDVVSAGWNDPVHFGIVRGEIICTDSKLHSFVLTWGESNTLESLELPYRTRCRSHAIVHV